MSDALSLFSEFVGEYPALSATLACLSILACIHFWIMLADREPIIDRNEWEG